LNVLPPPFINPLSRAQTTYVHHRRQRFCVARNSIIKEIQLTRSACKVGSAPAVVNTTGESTTKVSLFLVTTPGEALAIVRVPRL
jgi:hypothetical protein